MQIITPRLTLREVSMNDLETIHALNSLPETDEYNTLGIPANIQVTESLLVDWIADNTHQPRNGYVLAIMHTESNRFLGMIAMTLAKPKFSQGEVWYKLHPNEWNKGYATEALKGMLDFGFNTLGLHRIQAGVAVDNIASAKVLEKVGMIREGRKRKVLPIRGQWIDNFFYGILEEDWERINK
jgi:[ribosomal protein S5]-alanine N-acetyltransferase